METERFLAALGEARFDGVGVSEWSVFFSEHRTLELGIKDREIGNAHAPLKLSESCGARYRLIWSDGKVSRGYLERRLLEDDPATALENARAAAYEDPDAAVAARYHATLVAPFCLSAAREFFNDRLP